MKQDRVLYWKTHEEVINRSRPALIVTYGELVAGVSAIATKCGAPIADIATLEEALASSDHHPLCRPREDDIALLQHLVRNDGAKKGVTLSMDKSPARSPPMRRSGLDKATLRS